MATRKERQPKHSGLLRSGRPALADATVSTDFLASALIFLLATVVAVPLAKRYQLGAVLGYLAAGVVIGPDGLKLIESPDTVLAFSEIGVVLLLFVLGLELSPKRLKAMRRLVLAVGPAQVLATTAVVGAMVWAFLPGISAALIVGFSVAISSTAFAVQLLAERQEQHSDFGRGAFGVSLLQDLVAVPLVALLPLLALAGSNASAITASGAFVAFAQVLLAIALVIFIGRVALRPFLRLVAEVDTVEVFAAASLLVVLGTGWLMQEVGLSLGLGAFLAGVLLAESEYQHEIESHIAPYRGLLLGLFFIAVGMTLDLDLIAAQPFLVLGGLLAFLVVKALVMLAVGYAFGYRDRSLVLLAVLLACGGEFAFVVIETATRAALLPTEPAALLKVVIALSMAATPLLYLGVSALYARRPRTRQPYEQIPQLDAQVVIAGYGRVARVLQAQKIPYVAIDKAADSVEYSRSRFDRIVYYGDATRPEILRAARTGDARVFVVAIDDPEASIRCARLVRRLYPNVKLIARARNRNHAFRLMDLGITEVHRETLGTSLDITRRTLEALGHPEATAHDRVEQFREHDEALLKQQALVYDDETELVQSIRDAMDELDRIYEADARG